MSQHNPSPTPPHQPRQANQANQARRPAPPQRRLRVARPTHTSPSARLAYLSPSAKGHQPIAGMGLDLGFTSAAIMRTRITIAAAMSAVLLLPPVLVTGCASTSIWAKEAILGQAKRDQLVNSVVEARDEQEDAKNTFSSALDELLALSSGAQTTADLEAQYRLLETAYDRSSGKADDVRNRVADVERVASALFREWEAELDQYESASLREKSADQLRQTQDLYGNLISAMQDAAATMDPVLSAFKDQTLFLKHNLNARAIASLQTDLDEIRVDVQTLIAEMEAAIAEADEFISAVQGV